MIAQVQKTSITGAGSPITATFGSTPIQGNLLIAVVQESGQNATNDLTVAGFTSVGACAGFPGTGATFRRVGIFYKIAGASEPTAVVATGSSTATLITTMDMVILEYSGLATSSVLDKVANDGNNSGVGALSRTSGTTAATSQADELAIVGFGLAGSTSTIAYSNGFASEIETTRLGTASKILSATGTQESTRTWTTSRAAGGQIATFKALPRSPFSMAAGAALDVVGATSSIGGEL